MMSATLFAQTFAAARVHSAATRLEFIGDAGDSTLIHRCLPSITSFVVGNEQIRRRPQDSY